MATVSIQPRNFVILAVLAAAIVCPACYTLMKHPRISQLNYKRPANDKSCRSCHDRAQLYAFTHPPPLRAANGAWAGYYDAVWFTDLDSTTASDKGSD